MAARTPPRPKPGRPARPATVTIAPRSLAQWYAEYKARKAAGAAPVPAERTVAKA